MSSKKKKRKGKINVAMGDTVKLSKGRIGLIRFIGKTQFSLGEWIGIELYNELIRTRHNGAVLGKRYFRSPPHRGVFVRRSLIKENIAVLDIQKSINKLRAKEKKLKDERKKRLKKEKEAKKLKNSSKRESKRLKLQAKYGINSPKLTDKIAPFQQPKIDEKIEKIEKKQNKSNTKELPASFTNNTRDRKSSKKDKTTKKKGKNKRKQRSNSSNSKKRNSKDSKNKMNGNVIATTKEDKNESENDDFPPIDANEFVTAEPARKYKINHNKISKKAKKTGTRPKKSGSVELNISKKKDKKPKRNSAAAVNGIEVMINRRPVLKSSMSSPQTTPRCHTNDDDEKSQTYSDVIVAQRHSLPSTSKSIGANNKVVQLEMDGLNTEEKVQDMQILSNITRNVTAGGIITPGNEGNNEAPIDEGDEIIVNGGNDHGNDDENDGEVGADEDSLNDSEEEENEEENEHSVLREQKELEEDFEKNYDRMHAAVDEYTHTIDDIEDGRKKLANKIVMETKNRKKKNSDYNRNRGLKSYKQMREKIVSEHKRMRKKDITNRINPSLMIATMRNKKSKKKFDSARSRRGSSFVDDHNLNDTLFFDGDEETNTVKDDEQFYVDDMGSDDENENDNIILTESIIEEKEEEEKNDTETETETEFDPLLGTIDDDETEYEEEEMKIFDIEKNDENEKIIVFYEKLSEFLQWESNDENGFGMKISKLNNNEYGDALLNEININNQWNICIINKNDIIKMIKTDINQLIKKCETNVENGYSVTFKKLNGHHINDKVNLKPSVYVKSKKKVND